MWGRGISGNLSSFVRSQSLPTGALKGAEVELSLTGHNGIPATSLLLAYEPEQRLLGIGTRDGRIKFLGADGTEGLLTFPGKDPCKYLEFINKHNAIVSVYVTNEIKVFDVNDREVAAALQWNESITAFTVIPESTFMFVGDQSGTVSIIQYSVEDELLSVMPYSVPSHLALAGLVEAGSTDGGFVVAILPQPGAVHGRILIVYSIGLMVLWGLYEEQALITRGGSKGQHARLTGTATGKLSIAMDDEDPQEICNACWASSSGDLVAVGYLNGDVGLWHITDSSLSKAVEADPWCPLELVKLTPSEQRLPVSSLQYAADGQKSGRLYVLGGGDCQHPLKITVLSVLKEVAAELSARIELPWFGPVGDFKLLRETDDVCSPVTLVVVLDSSGQLRSYEEAAIADALSSGKDAVAEMEPVPLHLLLSEPTITVAKAFVSTERPSTISTLFEVLKGDQVASSSWVPRVGWSQRRVSGGRTAVPTLQLSGHKNGTVQVWDASSPGFHLVSTIPADVDKEEDKGGAYPPVSTVDFCPASGLLVVAHDGGLVRLYIFSKTEKEYCKRIVNGDKLVIEEPMATYDAGFQPVMDILLHQATVIYTSVASAATRVALGDTSGVVSLLDLRALSVLCLSKPTQIPYALKVSVVPSALSGIPAVSPRGSTDSIRSSQDIAAFVTNTKTASYFVNDKIGYEFQLTEPNMAKTSKLYSFLLDISGLYIPSPGSELLLPWTSKKPSVTPNQVVDLKQPDSPGVSSTAESPQKSSIESKESVGAIEGDTESINDEKEGTSTTAFVAGLSEPVLLLLCTERHLMMYNITAMPSGRFNFLVKADLPGTCIGAFPFGIKDVLPPGLLLVYQTGDVEVRSLPDLTVVAKTSISESLGWELQLNSTNLKTLSCTPDGQLSMVVFSEAGGSAEVVRMSILTNVSSKLQKSSADDNDADDSGIEEAQESSSGQRAGQNRPKVFKAFKSRLRGMAKEAKNVVATVQNNLPSEVTKVLKRGTKVVASLGSSVSNSLPARAKSFPRKSMSLLGMSSEKPVARSAADLPSLFMKPVGTSDELDIDDIDIDDIGSENFRHTVVEERTGSPQDVKKKASSSSERASGEDLEDKANIREASERAKLFAGGSSGSSSFTPQVRTAAEIRAKYGHPSASDLGGAAREARNKLAERGERLQAVSDKTQELEAGAANFASMAQELAKKMEGKKWWEM